MNGENRFRILWRDKQGREHRLRHRIGYGKQARDFRTCISVHQKEGAFGRRYNCRTIFPAFPTLLPSANSVGASHLKVKQAGVSSFFLPSSSSSSKLQLRNPSFFACCCWVAPAATESVADLQTLNPNLEAPGS
jgi:hypothetical protein